MTTNYNILRLPPHILTKIIVVSDPQTWWDTSNPDIQAIIDSTSFRCAWIAYLVQSADNIPMESPKCIGNLIDSRDVQLSISQLYGSEEWLNETFVHAMLLRKPQLFNRLALGLLWTSLLNANAAMATRILERSNIDLGQLKGKLLGGMIEIQPTLWMLEWLKQNGVDFERLCRDGNCFGLRLLGGWVRESRIDSLQFLIDHGLRLPVRRLIELSLESANPTTIEFLMQHGMDIQLTWNDLLLTPGMSTTTKVDVFRLIVSHTEPSIVWSFTAACLAAHALSDKWAYEKFTLLRSMPGAEYWMIQPVHGRTPIEILCNKLTYQNAACLYPFIQEYVSLGVSTEGMPNILEAICR